MEKRYIGEENFSKNYFFIYFDNLSKRVANWIILLFISKLIVVVHSSSESIHSLCIQDYDIYLYGLCPVDYFIDKIIFDILKTIIYFFKNE